MKRIIYNPVTDAMYSRLGGWMLYFVIASIFGIIILVMSITSPISTYESKTAELTTKIISIYLIIICIIIMIMIGKKTPVAYKTICILLAISLNIFWLVVFMNSVRAIYYFNRIEKYNTNEPEVYKDKIIKKLKSDKRCPVCGCYITNPTGACNACGYMPLKETKESSQVAEIEPNNNSTSDDSLENEQPKHQNINYESPEYLTILKNNMKKYPFNEKAVGSKNPYNGKTILTEKDYFECIMAYSTDEYKNTYNFDEAKV